MIVVVMIMLWCDGDEWCIVFNDSNDDYDSDVVIWWLLWWWCIWFNDSNDNYDGGDCDSVGDVMIKLIMVMTH